jgi:hypothetical protein
MHFQNKITNHGKWDVFVECLATDALFDVTISRSLDDQLLGRVVRAEMPTLHHWGGIERQTLNHNSGISWRRLPFSLPGL